MREQLSPQDKLEIFKDNIEGWISETSGVNVLCLGPDRSRLADYTRPEEDTELLEEIHYLSPHLTVILMAEERRILEDAKSRIDSFAAASDVDHTEGWKDWEKEGKHNSSSKFSAG